MKTFIALLRAVNVSGYNIIRMEKLRQIFESAGFKNVRTYIQSGNIIFDSSVQKPEKLRSKIENLLLENIGKEIITIIKSKDDWNSLIENNPFAEAELGKNLKLYITFLAEKPAQQLIDLIPSFNSNIEKYHLTDNNLYCLISKNIGKPIYSTGFVEKKLKVPATSRDWNTILKIQTMLEN